MRAAAIALALLTAAASAGAQKITPRNLLASRIDETELARILPSADAWHPYPRSDDRSAWLAVPETTRASYISAAAKSLGAPWMPIPASVTLQYVRDGNRSNYDGMSGERRTRLATLVMAEVFENQGRFLDDIANGIWAISEQTFWGSTAHLGLQRAGNGLPDAREPVVDLFAAEAAALFAWTDYLLGARLDSVSPRIRERIRYEVDRRVLTPALERDDFWWMGFGTRRIVNNWNPWINSNWLATTLILERDPARRARSVYKIMRSLDVFLNGYPDDGSCDEGPGYWGRAGASLFENLELLDVATAGKVNVFDLPLIQDIGRYIYRAYIGGDYYVNMGDAPARTTPDAEIIYRYGKRIHDPRMVGFGALIRRRHPYGEEHFSMGRIIPAMLGAAEIAAAQPAEPLLADVWLPDLQFMAARAVPDATRGVYVAAIGGHNAQSHNHNDVGNFVVYADAQPVLIDVGVETYTAKTFSSHRYEIWTMQSGYHNLPTINGMMQKDGAQYRASAVRFSGGDEPRLSLDIAAAYPADAHVRSWRRDISLARKRNEVTIEDAFVLDRSSEPLRLNFMTPLIVETKTPGIVRLRSASGDREYVLRYDAAKLSATAEEIALQDARLKSIWGNRVARLVLTGRPGVTRDSYRVVVASARR